MDSYFQVLLLYFVGLFLNLADNTLPVLPSMHFIRQLIGPRCAGKTTLNTWRRRGSEKQQGTGRCHWEEEAYKLGMGIPQNI